MCDSMNVQVTSKPILPVCDDASPQYSLFIVSVLKQEMLCWSSSKQIAMWTDHQVVFVYISVNQKQKQRLGTICSPVVKKCTTHKSWFYQEIKSISSVYPKNCNIACYLWLFRLNRQKRTHLHLITFWITSMSPKRLSKFRKPVPRGPKELMR